MTSSRRITFRLGVAEVTRLQKKGCEVGTDVSTVVRTALTAFLDGSPNAPTPTDRTAAKVAQPQIPVAVPTPATTTDVGLLTAAIKGPADSKAGLSAPAQLSLPETAKAVAPQPMHSGLVEPLPPSVADMIPQARHLGQELWRTRRVQFQRVLATSLVVTEHSEDGRDGKLCAELLRLGREFDLLH
jgi:hypothetical protein